MPQILWVGGPDPTQHFYWTKEPTLVVQWQKNVEGVTSWKVRVTAEGQNPSEDSWKPASSPMLKTQVPNEGTYSIDVEGLSTDGKTLARSSKKLVHAKPHALLPAPQFTKNLPTQLQADRHGNLIVEWQPVDGAKKYKVEIQSADGSSVIKEKVIDRTTASLAKLAPGNFKVTVKAIDAYDRYGESAPARDVSVPKKSAIRAPIIKKLKVK